MKKILTILSIFISVLPIVFTILFYHWGAFTLFLLIPIVFGISANNFFVAANQKSLIVLDVILVLSAVISNFLCVTLYYHNISSDDGTLFVGFLLAFLISIAYQPIFIPLIFKQWTPLS